MANSGKVRAGGPQRLALSKVEAAAALGVSVDFLEEHVMHELRVVRKGRRHTARLLCMERSSGDVPPHACGAGGWCLRERPSCGRSRYPRRRTMVCLTTITTTSASVRISE